MLSLSVRRAHIECVNLPKNVIALTSLAVAVADDVACALYIYPVLGIRICLSEQFQLAATARKKKTDSGTKQQKKEREWNEKKE